MSEPRSPAAGGTTAADRADAAPARWSVGVGLAAFLLYLALTPGVVGDGDSGEFTLTLAVGGVPHPPGYPLYSLLGNGWMALLHALGMGWARAANAWSALGAGLAVGLLHALAARVIPPARHLGRRGRAAAALVPVALFALGPAWLREATTAEVHGWHLAVLAAMALAALPILRDAASRDAPDIRAWRARGLVFGLACGAGLAHHPTAIFFVAPIGLAVLTALARARRLGAALPPALPATILLPVAAHGFTLWRSSHPAAFQWPLLEPGLAATLAHARGRIFATFLGAFSPRPDQAAMLADSVYPFLVPGLALLVVAIALARAPGMRALLSALLAGAAFQLGFVLLYGVPDCVPYFLPALMAATLGLAAIAGRLAARMPHPAATLPVALGVVVAGAVWVKGTALENRRLVAVDEAIRARWRAIPFERGIVLWQSDWWTRLRAFQILDREKPGVQVENPAMLTWGAPRRAFERRLGFDPLAGLVLRDDSDLPLIAGNIARQTSLPVLDFERWRP